MYWLEEIGGSGLLLAQMAFTLWMAVDAYQRRAEQYWFWIIFLFQPLGAWAYFVAIKMKHLRTPWSSGEPLWQRRVPLDELRFRLKQAPTVVNKLALAERLRDDGAPAEAIPLLESVVSFEPNHCDALHILAECYLASEQADRAIPHLQKLLSINRYWGNYRGWRTLIQAHETRGEQQAALKVCRDLERQCPTLEYRCLLAEHLLHHGQKDEAAQVLHQALEQHHFAAFGSRWRNRSWARQAKMLLQEAEG